MSPDHYTIKQKKINVGDGHSIFTYLWGNKDSDTTIVFLHGGPGNGCNDRAKDYFDPKRHRVLFFDQRGCGKSTPYGSLKENNTNKLIEDINVITKDYDIDRFVLTGGSWGSFLALAYALRYPNKVIKMVIRGVFTGRSIENEYLYNGHFKPYFPDVWYEFIEATPDRYRSDPSKYHMSRVLGSSKEQAKRSAFALSKLEGSLMRLDDRTYADNFEEFDPAATIIETHFMKNKCFVKEGYILANAHKLKMPISIVQGRYDMACPPVTAYQLHQKLPNSKLYLTIAGHSGSDRNNWDVVRTIFNEN